MSTTTETPRAAAVGDVVEERWESATASAATASAYDSRLRGIWMTLRLTYGLVPIVAGLDKFTNMLVNWEAYLNPALINILPLPPSAFMGIVGVIEIVAGILVLARPRIGGFIVMGWLICIALSLLASGNYLDVAVRDLVMAIGAHTLARLTPLVQQMNPDRE